MTPKYAIATAKRYHKSCLLHIKDYSSLVINCFSIFLQVYFAVVLLMTFDLLTCVHSQCFDRALRDLISLIIFAVKLELNLHSSRQQSIPNVNNFN